MKTILIIILLATTLFAQSNEYLLQKRIFETGEKMIVKAVISITIKNKSNNLYARAIASKLKNLKNGNLSNQTLFVQLEKEYKLVFLSLEKDYPALVQDFQKRVEKYLQHSVLLD